MQRVSTIFGFGSGRSFSLKTGGVMLGAVAAATLLAACQTTTPPAPTGNLLTSAGFTMKVADTPARQAKLASVPAGKMIPRVVKGKTLYFFADPKGCNCVYVGDETAYQSYQQLGRNRSVPSDKMLMAEMKADNSWNFDSNGFASTW